MKNISKKRICLAVNSFGAGGAERVMLTLANKFHEWGYSVDFIVRDDIGLYKNKLNPQINKVVLTYHTDGRIKKRLNAAINLWKYFRSGSADVMMATLDNLNILCSIVRFLSFSKTPLYLRQAATLDNLIRNNCIKNKIILYNMRFFYQRADCIIANSNDTRQDLITYLSLCPKKIIVINNPLQLKEIKNKIINVRKNEKPTIIACGRLNKGKNMVDLISAFPNILQKIPEAQLIIIGEGEERTNLQMYIKKLGMEDCITLEGIVNDPYLYYASSHVFVQTSLWEGFGYVLVEAMACGTPIVAYDSKGPMREILADGKYGKLVPVGDLNLLADSIVEQINNPTPSEILRETVLRFDEDKIAMQYLNALDIFRIY